MTTVMTVALFQYQFPSQIPSLTPLIPNLPLHTILSPLHHQRAGLSLNTNQPPPQTTLLIQNTPSMECGAVALLQNPLNLNPHLSHPKLNIPETTHTL